MLNLFASWCRARCLEPAPALQADGSGMEEVHVATPGVSAEASGAKAGGAAS